MSDLIQVNRDGRVLHIALNRPEKRNALNLALAQQLVTALETGADDPHIGALLLTGNGPAFCAGLDLTEILSSHADEVHRVHEQLFSASLRLTKPIVAAVHGAALAGGTGLAANSHILLAAEDATLGLTEIHLGMWPFLVFRPVALAMGERRATELSLTGRTLSAVEAYEYGLVSEICAPDRLCDRAREVAHSVSCLSPTAVRSGLTFVQEIRQRDCRQAAEIARRVRTQLCGSADFAEGVRAAQEKRAPVWPSLREMQK